jgi:uncharacterized membrane protein YphA (DoxX/SURF4 family)
MKISILLSTPPPTPFLPPAGTFGHWCQGICIALFIITGLLWKFTPSYRKIWTTICRIVVGLLFIFSGFVKADDPTGFDIKLKEYFASDALNLPWLDKFSFPMAFSFSIIELILGIMILIGARKKLSLTLIVLMTTFFTFLTWYTAHYNKVNECGCFGDAVPMTAVESFWKNIVLMAFIVITVFGAKHISPLLKGKTQNIVILTCLLAAIAFSGYCYNYLPVLDFRPYKIGTDIKKAMKGVPGLDKYYYTCTNKKTGEQKEFESIPDSTTWKYVSYRTETIKKGVDPVDFNISALAGEDVTDSILSIPTYNFLLVSVHMNDADVNPDVVKKINNLASDCLKNHIGFICLTNSGPDEIAAYQKKFNPPYKFFNTDEVVLKTMIRSNPGLILIKGGVVKAMWHYHSIPSYSDAMEKYLH